MEKYFPDPDVQWGTLDWVTIFCKIQKLGEQVAFSMLKICSGNLETSARRRQLTQPCKFCTAEKDHLAHIFDCHILLKCISESLPGFQAHFGYGELLGLAPYEPKQILGLACAFECYNAVKSQHVVSASQIKRVAKNWIFKNQRFAHTLGVKQVRFVHDCRTMDFEP